MRVLITGGAGFIGSHLADALLADGHRVRALDCLSSQVHGNDAMRPAYLHPDVDLVVGNVEDPDAVAKALEGVEAVYHLAARVGVGQSMYEPVPYTRANVLGTAVLLDALMRRPVERLVVASSMSIYGEGLYRCRVGQQRTDVLRDAEQLSRHQWDACDEAGHPLVPLPTPETKPIAASSLYALSKLDQERMCLMYGEAYGIPTLALRFFNVYGTRQALSNPYTGVLAIFAGRLLHDRRPRIFEDGEQRRDFVHVSDVVQALCLAALQQPEVSGEALNVGSGRSVAIREVAEALTRVMGKDGIQPLVSGEYRVGDVRHCFADIQRARHRLGYAPCVGLDQGLLELCAWLESQAPADPGEQAVKELAARGLSR